MFSSFVVLFFFSFVFCYSCYVELFILFYFRLLFFFYFTFSHGIIFSNVVVVVFDALHCFRCFYSVVGGFVCCCSSCLVSFWFHFVPSNRHRTFIGCSTKWGNGCCWGGRSKAYCLRVMCYGATATTEYYIE